MLWHFPKWPICLAHVSPGKDPMKEMYQFELRAIDKKTKKQMDTKSICLIVWTWKV